MLTCVDWLFLDVEFKVDFNWSMIPLSYILATTRYYYDSTKYSFWKSTPLVGKLWITGRELKRTGHGTGQGISPILSMPKGALVANCLSLVHCAGICCNLFKQDNLLTDTILHNTCSGPITLHEKGHAFKSIYYRRSQYLLIAKTTIHPTNVPTTKPTGENPFKSFDWSAEESIPLGLVDAETAYVEREIIIKWADL